MKIGPSNHHCFATAFREYAGRELSTEAIKAILLQRYPTFAQNSILPSYHADGNNGRCSCVGTEQRIFDTVKRGLFRVRPTSPC
jgi:hypothetical protein